ncbi:MAG: PPOX class F420-dependent oxidoreductase [Chloroflexota bacterium]|nr:PPOX class F420-dependent oxidoreductase [Chloroflexota bacterium]
MVRLKKEEREQFLAQPRIAHLVTLRPTGTPHVSPVWFLWEGEHGNKGRVLVMVDGNAVKVRNVQSNPSVALSIATPERPLSYVVLEGQAEVTSEGLNRAVERMCVLYDGEDRGAEFAKQLLSEERMVLLQITIDRIMSWQDED